MNSQIYTDLYNILKMKTPIFIVNLKFMKDRLIFMDDEELKKNCIYLTIEDVSYRIKVPMRLPSTIGYVVYPNMTGGFSMLPTNSTTMANIKEFAFNRILIRRCVYKELRKSFTKN